MKKVIVDSTYELVKALRSPLKWNIIQYLEKHQTRTVTDIYIMTRNSQSNVSHALKQLQVIGIVSSERLGHYVHYSLNRSKLRDILNAIRILEKENNETSIHFTEFAEKAEING